MNSFNFFKHECTTANREMCIERENGQGFKGAIRYCQNVSVLTATLGGGGVIFKS